MTSKKKQPAPKFEVGQRVVYHGWFEQESVQSAHGIIIGYDKDKYSSQKFSGKMSHWYYIRLIGDKYSRRVCEDDMSRIPNPKFFPGDTVDYKSLSPDLEGSGIVVEIIQDEETGLYSYDVWITDNNGSKRPFRFAEKCLNTKKTKKK